MVIHLDQDNKAAVQNLAKKARWKKHGLFALKDNKTARHVSTQVGQIVFTEV